MIDTKISKIAKTFICNNCNYKCYKQSEFNKHLLTRKHEMLGNAGKKVVKVAKSYICDCGKEYKHNQSYYRHKGVCVYTVVDVPSNSVINNENNSILELILQNKELMNLLITKNHQTDDLIHQTDELIQQNKEMQKTVLEMVPKIGNNTTNNNNQFNLQVFLTEDCKDALNFSDFVKKIQIAFADLENQAENGYVKGISQLFMASMNELGKHKRPIHCTDAKRKTLYIKEDDEWCKDGSLDILKKGIQEVTCRTYGVLNQSKIDNAEEYRDGDSEFSGKCVTILQNLLPKHPRETSINKVVELISKTTTLDEKA